MSEYDADDLARDRSQNRQMALFVAALSGQRGTRVPALIARADKIEAHLNAALPTVTQLVEEPCHREQPHRGHKFYGELDDRSWCNGKGKVDG